MVFNDRPTCKDRHAAELILARSTRLHQRPNTLPQTCLLARTNPCSHAADHTLSDGMIHLCLMIPSDGQSGTMPEFAESQGIWIRRLTTPQVLRPQSAIS